MAHQRILKHEFFTDYDVCQMEPLCRLFFEGLWCQADRNGTIKDNPHELKARVMPYDPIDPEAFICELINRKFLIRFKVGDQRLLAIRTWKKNQPVNKNERGSELPDVSQATEIVALPLLPSLLNVNRTTAEGQLSVFPVPAPSPSPVPAPLLAGEKSPAPQDQDDDKGCENKPKGSREAHPEHQRTVEALMQAFLAKRGSKYDFRAKHGRAVRDLLKAGHEPAEILRRWDVSLELGSKWPGTADFAAFAERFNDFAPGGPKSTGRDSRRGYANAADNDWSPEALKSDPLFGSKASP